ncbi:MAG: RNA methyltransferase [Candidatus Marinimicrobia bacterium]|nr:RNA methyltransferase [Candidatus Neomarinimicrobiota bacterium]
MPLSNTVFKAFRALSQKKHRLASGKIVIEGWRLIESALQSPAVVERVLCNDDFRHSDHGATFSALAAGRNIPVESLTPTQAEQLSDIRTPPGAYAVVTWPDRPAPTDLRPPILVLDAIANPGNLGTLLRTADWFGLPTVLVSDDSADITNPKVVRGGMGAHFHLPQLYQGELASQLAAMQADGTVIIGATLEGGPLSAVPAPPAWALVLGSEAHGLSAHWSAALNVAVTIPSAGAAESLNVAVAGGIILNHLLQPAP